MSFSLDLSLLATLFGFVMVILTGLVYWGKVNFLIFAQKQIIIELASTNKELLVKAERYSHGTRLSGPKIRISRLMSSFSRQYVVPSSVMVVSGLAAVAWLFCLFLMVASYIYTGVQHISIINIILLVACMVGSFYSSRDTHGGIRIIFSCHSIRSNTLCFLFFFTHADFSYSMGCLCCASLPLVRAKEIQEFKKGSFCI